MSDELDFVDEVERPAPPARSAHGRKFDDGLEGATRRQAARASGRRSVARGQYVQLTFRLPEDAVARIGRMATDLGVTQEDLKRWLVWRGLQAWDDGERPEVDAEVVRRARMEW